MHVVPSVKESHVISTAPADILVILMVFGIRKLQLARSSMVIPKAMTANAVRVFLVMLFLQHPSVDFLIMRLWVLVDK